MGYHLGQDVECFPQFIQSFLMKLRVSSGSTNFIYFLGFYSLFCKYPKYFREYQRILLHHTISNWVFEIFVTVFFEPYFVLPWFGICSYGLLSNYTPYLLIVLVGTFIGLGITIIQLFASRYLAIAFDKRGKKKNIMKYIKRTIYLFYIVTLVTFIISYDDMVNQGEYYTWVNQTSGPLPTFVECNNCFLMNYSKNTTVISLIFGTCSIFLCIIFVLTLGALSYYSLKKCGSSVSKNSVKMQKNFLKSLSLQVFVHISFLAIPLSFFLSAFVINIKADILTSLSPYCVFLGAQHGSMATLTMLFSVKLIKEKLKLKAKQFLYKIGIVKTKPTSYNNVVSVISDKRT